MQVGDRYLHEQETIKVRAAVAILLVLSVTVTSAGDVEGRVIRVADGDTFTLRTGSGDDMSVRLAEIDAPEAGQPYGNRSKQQLSSLILSKEVSVEVQTSDRYGRTVGRPYVGDLDVCREMVRLGAAWVYREYVIDRSLFDVEREATDSKRGLWGITEARSMPPWEWRRRGGQEAAPEDCTIKGNINSRGDRVYHVPGHKLVWRDSNQRVEGRAVVLLGGRSQGRRLARAESMTLG